MSVQGKTYLVTGGTGFIGRGLVASLLRAGAKVRTLDNESRGSAASLDDMYSDVEIVTGDVRDIDVVRRATKGVDCVCHLAYVNGTGFFYSMPERVLEVAVKGIMNVVDACIQNSVGELCLASSSEVYQTPPHIPTAEDVPLSVPDPLNPRFSYGGGKIVSELITLNYGRKHFQRVTVFRPHNVYGPNMGWEHVVPQFITRMRELVAAKPLGTINFLVQGTGQETRAFVYIDDAAEGILRVLEAGDHMGIYHVGTETETSIAELGERIAQCFGREIRIVPGQLTAGSTQRRCPDITKLRMLGYNPRVSLAEGLLHTVAWYRQHDPPQKGIT